MITRKELQAELYYNYRTGNFTWTGSGRGRTNNVAGTNYRGYVRIQVNGTRYLAHNLACLYMTGSFPKGNVTHINGIKNDNRSENLQEFVDIGAIEYVKQEINSVSVKKNPDDILMIVFFSALIATIMVLTY